MNKTTLQNLIKFYGTIDEWRAASGMGRSVTYYAIADGRIRAIKLGARTLIDFESGRRYLDSLPSISIQLALGGLNPDETAVEVNRGGQLEPTDSEPPRSSQRKENKPSRGSSRAPPKSYVKWQRPGRGRKPTQKAIAHIVPVIGPSHDGHPT